MGVKGMKLMKATELQVACDSGHGCVTHLPTCRGKFAWCRLSHNQSGRGYPYSTGSELGLDRVYKILNGLDLSGPDPDPTYIHLYNLQLGCDCGHSYDSRSKLTTPFFIPFRLLCFWITSWNVIKTLSKPPRYTKSVFYHIVEDDMGGFLQLRIILLLQDLYLCYFLLLLVFYYW